MTNEDATEAVFAAIREELDEPELALDLANGASDVPGWDSLAHVRIILNIGIRVGHEIDPTVTYELETIGDLADFVAERDSLRHYT